MAPPLNWRRKGWVVLPEPSVHGGSWNPTGPKETKGKEETRGAQEMTLETVKARNTLVSPFLLLPCLLQGASIVQTWLEATYMKIGKPQLGKKEERKTKWSKGKQVKAWVSIKSKIFCKNLELNTIFWWIKYPYFFLEALKNFKGVN